MLWIVMIVLIKKHPADQLVLSEETDQSWGEEQELILLMTTLKIGCC